MAKDATSPPADLADPGAEIARLNKIIRVLMDRAEGSTSDETSDYGLFQATIMLEQQVCHRTAELQAALRENERINCALRERAEAEQRVLQESEQRLRALLQNCSDMITVVARDGSVLYQAGAIGSVLGHEPTELEGANLARWVDKEDLPRLLELCHTGQAASTELHLRHADGRPRTCEVLAASLPGDSSWDGVVLNIRDVTERKQLELELRLAQKLESIGQLAAGIAHEINTPVQFVGNSVIFLKRAADKLLTLTNVYHELLHSDQPIDKEERQRRAVLAEEDTDLEYLIERIPPAFERALDGIKRVSVIVHAMRQFAHPSTERAPTDVNDGLQTTLIVAANEYKYVADIELDLGELPLVMANAGDLNQVFLNLIVNAAHAIEAKAQDSGERGKIIVRTRADDAGVLITVSDSGCGIQAEIAERVFDPFFTTKEIGSGTGQGLAIAHTIVVERHGGTITHQPTPGGGATFRILLPPDDPAAGGESIDAAA
jgi:PAS domain S-box-containing protein